MTAELLTIPSDLYHRDEVGDRPSLSKSIIQLLVDASPAHARQAHPKLNADFVREDDDKFNLGNAAHQLFLEGINGVAVLPYEDWRSKAAKEDRDTARADGRIPMLAKQWNECEAMVDAIRRQCDTHPEGPFFTDGKPEQTMVWEDEYGVLCRARLDWLLNDYSAVHDLKTTRASASPAAWSRTALSIGAELQAVFYLRGCRAVLGSEPDFRFIVSETTAPFAASVFALAPDTLALAEKKVSYALKTWATCLRNDDWPAYEQRTAYIETPPWQEGAWLEREIREVAA